MKTRDLLQVQSIELNGHASSKEDAINKMVELMVKQGNVKDAETYKKALKLGLRAFSKGVKLNDN